MMRKSLVLLALCLSFVLPSQAEPLSVFDDWVQQEENIESTLRLAAEYQLESYGDPLPVKSWLVGTFFSGMIEAYHATGDKWYIKQSRRWADASEWGLHNAANADDLCPAQTYLDLHFIKKNKKALAALNETVRPLLDKKVYLAGELSEYQKQDLDATGRNIWSWADSLYMAPPVYARLGQATGDQAYFDRLHDMYWDAVDFLYDEKEHLFYRDERYLPQNNDNKKVFWSRGNGWVFAGLARMIDYIPEKDPERPRYIKLFQEMAYRLVKEQQTDGLWRSDLGDVERYPTKETSGSAFFVYGFAKGVNEGWLPKRYFDHAIVKGWSGLVATVTPEGRLTHVQLVAGSPSEVRPWDSVDYAVGGLLLAGAEVLEFSRDAQVSNPKAGELKPKVITDEGSYTWYTDERAIFAGQTLYVSYVKRDGTSSVSSFGLDYGTAAVNAKHEMPLSSWKEVDDHDNASLLALPDGKVLATYAMHGTDGNFYQRTIEPRRWDTPIISDESKHYRVKTRFGMTYQNLVMLSAENKRIYNFFRGIDFNPTFVYSDDAGKTWSEAYKLFESGSNSSHRPYVKYSSNGVDRIDFIFTDGHPRDVKDNHVYHAYLKGGVFYDSQDKVLSSLDEVKKKPIIVSTSSQVFDGSTENGRAWVWDLEYDAKGQPRAGFISSPSGDIGSDMRYWQGNLIDGQWQTEQIAYAGSNIYKEEQHFAGGLTLAPNDENRVVISANVNPESGEPLANGLYQLFRGDKIKGQWQWQQLTFDPARNQLHPFLVRTNGQSEQDVLVWKRGDYIWFGDFYTDIVMSEGIGAPQ
ncbi:glycoside hydrolase family 88 protein [Agaribacterium sp. ZY112]|uniref:glycoside hydrolase family 88 protein n=1 Tax=Agaribacterium sp. ZY112 TaxID=3233574 RepID=UPI0035238468